MSARREAPGTAGATRPASAARPGDVDLDALLPRPTKVFGIGLHKTSTSSLAAALYTLGYHVDAWWDPTLLPDEAARRDHVRMRAQQHDAVQDMPWPLYYQTLDEAFPGSRFVLTLRDVEAWTRSVRTHFGGRGIAAHEHVYGVPDVVGHEDVYVARHEQHLAAVRAHFAARPDDLLEMDITRGDGWDVLCPFLGLPVPDLPFPSQNAAGQRSSTRYRRAARRAALAVQDVVRLPRTPSQRRFVGAWAAFPLVHATTRRVDALHALADVLPDEQAAAVRALLADWSAEQVGWLVEVDAPQLGGTAAAGGAAWPSLRLATRAWTADLTDDVARAATRAGRSGSEAVRDMVLRTRRLTDEVAAVASTAGTRVVADRATLELPS